MHRVFAFFADLLNERFAVGAFTKEDSVRYTFFYALLSKGTCSHTDVILESAHPVFSGKEIDILVLDHHDQPSAAFEFKYDKVRNAQQNRPQRAGNAFKDMFRLAYISKTIADRKYFVYLTDHGMATYFRNPKNELSSIFEMEEQQSAIITDDFINTRSSTFQQIVKPYQRECRIICDFRRNLNDNHYLRIYNITTNE